VRVVLRALDLIADDGDIGVRRSLRPSDEHAQVAGERRARLAGERDGERDDDPRLEARMFRRAAAPRVHDAVDPLVLRRARLFERDVLEVRHVAEIAGLGHA